jgi:hypothetical protein
MLPILTAAAAAVWRGRLGRATPPAGPGVRPAADAAADDSSMPMRAARRAMPSRHARPDAAHAASRWPAVVIAAVLAMARDTPARTHGNDFTGGQ